MIPKKYTLHFFLSIFFYFIIIASVSGQQSQAYTNPFLDYNKALELYNNNQFAASQMLFTKIKEQTNNQDLKGDCSYYIASAAVRLNQKDADRLMQDFVSQYPTHIKRNNAFIDVANYYFDNGKYAYARKWFDKVDETSLNPSEKESFYFKNGYSYFYNKRFNEAKKYFSKITQSKKYASQAAYYLGYIAYQRDDFNEANTRFEEVKGDTDYGPELSYYQADMNFKLGNFEKAIQLGKEQFNKSNPKEKSELAKIIGESYFNLENYNEAIPYLLQYKGKRGKWNNTDYYQLGYAYYKQGDYKEAINYFNKIIDGENSVAQNAYYHLADSYLKLSKKQEALHAFKNASEMNFSLEIQEDAHFNYAKLSYEIGNSFQSVPKVLMDFLKKYPDNPNSSLINDLLINSYITSKDYKNALELLENNKSFSNKKAYQQVAFYRGAELFTQGDYKEAKIYFDKSLKEPQDNALVARATYWKAQADYLLSHFEEALIGFKQFLQFAEAQYTPEFKQVNYQLGYTYFKLKNYSQAKSMFAQFATQSKIDKTYKADAFLRLADCNFITSDYWKALENYNKAIENDTPDKDYALFQKSISYGFVGKESKKIAGLQNLVDSFSKSIYKDDALYELGNTYLNQNNNQKALDTYNLLIQTLPKSSFVPKALLKKALILENQGSSNQALSIFKKVAEDYAGTPEAVQAVSSAKIIFIDQGKVSDYATWVKTLDFISVENAELDEASYKSAEQPYLEDKPAIAIERFSAYLKQFPEGNHALESHFYLAQLYFNQDAKEQAIPHYTYVAQKERNQFSEQALARLSEWHLSKKQYQQALQFLAQLEEVADYQQNKIFAQTNSMKAHYELAHYNEATAYAEKVLNNPKIDSNIKADAQIIIARVAIKTGDETKAEAAYNNVAKIATGKLAAEALYYQAYFKNKSGLFKASNTLIQKLAKEFSQYKYWGAKGLVLMAKNFYALKDAFQATYILDNVIKNFTDFPEIVETAKEQLDEIKKQESKTNDSIEVEEKN